MIDYDNQCYNINISVTFKKEYLQVLRLIKIYESINRYIKKSIYVKLFKKSKWYKQCADINRNI